MSDTMIDSQRCGEGDCGVCHALENVDKTAREAGKAFNAFNAIRTNSRFNYRNKPHANNRQLARLNSRK